MTARQIRARLIGRTITKIELRHFENGRGGRATAPIIYLDDGSYICFDTQETEVGCYGTQIIVGPLRGAKP